MGRVIAAVIGIGLSALALLFGVVCWGAALTAPDKSLVTPRPMMAKATLPVTSPLSSVVTESAKRVYGKQGAAAERLGKDEGNFSRDVKAGRTTLADLERLGPEYLAELGKELVESYAPLATPAARIRHQIKVIETALEEVRQGVEALSA